MAKLADAPDLGSGALGVQVRLLLSAPKKHDSFRCISIKTVVLFYTRLLLYSLIVCDKTAFHNNTSYQQTVRNLQENTLGFHFFFIIRQLTMASLSLVLQNQTQCYHKYQTTPDAIHQRTVVVDDDILQFPAVVSCIQQKIEVPESS